MSANLLVQIGFDDVCRLSDTSSSTIITIVEHGIIQPQGNALQQPTEWHFDPQTVATAKKAIRLHRDLDIEWAGIALAIDLLQDLETLRNENELLKQRIERFINC